MLCITANVLSKTEWDMQIRDSITFYSKLFQLFLVLVLSSPFCSASLLDIYHQSSQHAQTQKTTFAACILITFTNPKLLLNLHLKASAPKNHTPKSWKSNKKLYLRFLYLCSCNLFNKNKTYTLKINVIIFFRELKLCEKKYT